MRKQKKLDMIKRNWDVVWTVVAITLSVLAVYLITTNIMNDGTTIVEKYTRIDLPFGEEKFVEILPSDTELELNRLVITSRTDVIAKITFNLVSGFVAVVFSLVVIWAIWFKLVQGD